MPESGDPSMKFAARLEAWLRRKRWTVALLLPLVGVAGFAMRAWLGPGPWSAIVGWPPMLVAINALLALPLVIGLRGLWGRSALVAMLLLALFSWLIEGIGVATGWPYGHFRYALGLEPLLFDRVPLALPLFWLPMVLAARMLAIASETWWDARKGRAAHPIDSGRGLTSARENRSPAVAGALRLWLAGVLFLVALDLILDPGAVALGFWAWDDPGPWYGVPWINYAGWLQSGAVAMILAGWALPDEPLRRQLAADGLAWGSLLAFLAFWGPVNLLLGQWLPALIASALALPVALAYRREPQSDFPG
jgi:putative membrane protein